MHCNFDKSHPFLVNAAKFQRYECLDLLSDLNFVRRDSAISLNPHSDDHFFEDQVVLRATTNECFPAQSRLLQPKLCYPSSSGISSPASSTISTLDQPSSGVVDQNTFALIQSGIETRSSKFYLIKRLC